MSAIYKFQVKCKRGNICSLSLIFCSILLFITACGGEKEVKKESYDYRITREAFSVAEALRTAYMKKDFSSIQQLSTKEGFSEIIDSIRHFESVDLTFTPKWVEIEKSKIYLNVAWKGIWIAGGETTRERGMAVFLLDGSPLKVSKVLRGSPFKYPER
jgi:hypothetical protein